jgi:hypothetical protein
MEIPRKNAHPRKEKRNTQSFSNDPIAVLSRATSIEFTALIGTSERSEQKSRILVKNTKWFVLVAAVAVCAGSPAFAVSLPANSSFLSTGAGVPVGGVAVAGGAPLAFSSATFAGTLTTTVISGDTSNPYGGLTFTYLLTNDLASTHAIERLTINGYSGFLVEANYQTPTSDQIPTLFDRSAGLGDTVGESFYNPIISLPGFGNGVLSPGATSALLVLQTDAQFYQLSTANVIDGSVATVATFAPVPAIPEPSSIALASLGFIGLALWRRRRRI